MESTLQFWPRHSSIRSDEGLTLETSALKLFTVANLDWLNEKRSLIPWVLRLQIRKTLFCSFGLILTTETTLYFYKLYYFIK